MICAIVEMVGDDFPGEHHLPRRETISHGGISSLPSHQTPIHEDIHKGGAATGRPSFVEAAAVRLPH